MLTNENDNPLIDVLQDVETSLAQLPAAELYTFDQGWQALLLYTEQPDSTQAGLLNQLYQLLSASPTLKQQRLHLLVSEVSRFMPRPDEANSVNKGDGLAPVRNEVVKAVHQLGNTIRQQSKSTKSPS
jgi:hypothetical protein